MSPSAMLRGALLALGLVTITACHDGPFSPYWDRGTYELVAANGRYVPSNVYVAAGPGHVDAVDVVDGWITLHGDGSYELIVHARETTNGLSADVTHAYAGGYDTDGNMLYLSYDLPGSYYSDQLQASWHDGIIEVVVPDVAMGHGVLMRFGR
ncbi:MAG: hypothetical protein HYR75_05365 [Gemmatimonadetes bacterium]|nr:hypothetical protein [Gemmatimonadota bacterium]MBI3568587.1 hypothetical protein [Gemmatimonadota bacterium]